MWCLPTTCPTVLRKRVKMGMYYWVCWVSPPSVRLKTSHGIKFGDTLIDIQSDDYLNKGMCHTVALPFTLKSILRQKKKNYGNSNIYFTMQNYNLQKKIL
jgi:hypothetical protein